MPKTMGKLVKSIAFYQLETCVCVMQFGLRGEIPWLTSKRFKVENTLFFLWLQIVLYKCCWHLSQNGLPLTRLVLGKCQEPPHQIQILTHHIGVDPLTYKKGRLTAVYNCFQFISKLCQSHVSQSYNMSSNMCTNYYDRI